MRNTHASCSIATLNDITFAFGNKNCSFGCVCRLRRRRRRRLFVVVVVVVSRVNCLGNVSIHRVVYSCSVFVSAIDHILIG